VKEDKKVAMHWLKKASANSDADAMAALGRLYREGSAGEKDLEKAIQYIQKAAEMGSQVAELELGYMYKEGIGFKKDIQQAFAHFKKCRRTWTSFWLLECRKYVLFHARIECAA